MKILIVFWLTTAWSSLYKITMQRKAAVQLSALLFSMPDKYEAIVPIIIIKFERRSKNSHLSS
jgi:hypothetical protein